MPSGRRYASPVTLHRGTHRLTNMELDFVSLVAAGDDPLAAVVISKAAPEDKSGGSAGDAPTIHHNTPPKEKNVATINKSDLDPEVVAYIDSLEDEVETLGAQVEKSEADIEVLTEEVTDLKGTLSKTAPKDDEAADEINKALLAKADPAVRALIEKSQADLKAATDIAKAERESRLSKEYVSKAEALPMLSEDRAALASMLRHASEALSEEDNKTLDGVLKSANEHIKQSNLFKSFGTGGGETTVSKSLRSKAEDIRKEQPTLTIEQAEVLAMEQNPDLAQAAFAGEEN